MSGRRVRGDLSDSEDDYVPDLPPDPISMHPDGLTGEERDRVQNAARLLVRRLLWSRQHRAVKPLPPADCVKQAIARCIAGITR